MLLDKQKRRRHFICRQGRYVVLQARLQRDIDEENPKIQEPFAESWLER